MTKTHTKTELKIILLQPGSVLMSVTPITTEGCAEVWVTIWSYVGVWGPFCCWAYSDLNVLRCHRGPWWHPGMRCCQGPFLGPWSCWICRLYISLACVTTRCHANLPCWNLRAALSLPFPSQALENMALPLTNPGRAFPTPHGIVGPAFRSEGPNPHRTDPNGIGVGELTLPLT